MSNPIMSNTCAINPKMSVIISAKIIVVCFDMFEVSTFKFERFYACVYLTESLIFAKSVVYNSHSRGAWE